MSNDKYVRLYESLQNAYKQLHQQFLMTQQRMLAAEERLVQMTAALRTQERVTEQQLLESNRAMNAVLEENGQLRAELKRAKDGAVD